MRHDQLPTCANLAARSAYERDVHLRTLAVRWLEERIAIYTERDITSLMTLLEEVSNEQASQF